MMAELLCVVCGGRLSVKENRSATPIDITLVLMCKSRHYTMLEIVQLHGHDGVAMKIGAVRV